MPIPCTVGVGSAPPPACMSAPGRGSQSWPWAAAAAAVAAAVVAAAAAASPPSGPDLLQNK